MEANKSCILAAASRQEQLFIGATGIEERKRDSQQNLIAEVRSEFLST
jgi:hypothetical protein